MTTEQIMQYFQNGETPPMEELIPYGLINALTVMIVVFAVLGILYLILTISGAIFSRLDAAKKSEPAGSKSPVPADGAVGDEVLAVLSAAVQAAQNDGELIAVLTAAVEAARTEAGETTPFRVVSFRRR